MKILKLLNNTLLYIIWCGIYCRMQRNKQWTSYILSKAISKKLKQKTEEKVGFFNSELTNGTDFSESQWGGGVTQQGTTMRGGSQGSHGNQWGALWIANTPQPNGSSEWTSRDCTLYLKTGKKDLHFQAGAAGDNRASSSFLPAFSGVDPGSFEAVCTSRVPRVEHTAWKTPPQPESSVLDFTLQAEPLAVHEVRAIWGGGGGNWLSSGRQH